MRTAWSALERHISGDGDRGNSDRLWCGGVLVSDVRFTIWHVVVSEWTEIVQIVIGLFQFDVRIDGDVRDGRYVVAKPVEEWSSVWNGMCCVLKEITLYVDVPHPSHE